MEKSYYDILGVDSNAEEGDIKSAYRKLARKWHPDIAGNSKDVEMKFKEITEAYETLSNSIKRKKYDTLRGIFHRAKTTREQNNNSEKVEQPESETTKQKNPTEQENKPVQENTNKDNSKTFQKAWDSFMKKTKAPEKTKQNKQTKKQIYGSDMTSEITITVLEALQGTTRKVNILHSEPCSKCRGRKFANGSVCAMCNGVGEISIHKKLSVKIPEKIKDGSKIRIASEGNQGYDGGKNGDLYLIVKVDTESTIYKYDGLNILQTVPVEPFEAVLGGHIEVKTPEGNISMKIMAGTVNGQKYRLAKQGIEKDGKKGDMIVTIEIDIPKNLSKDEVILYERLRQICNRKIREVVND